MVRLFSFHSIHNLVLCNVLLKLKSYNYDPALVETIQGYLCGVLAICRISKYVVVVVLCVGKHDYQFGML